jgi:hypothetical protein
MLTVSGPQPPPICPWLHCPLISPPLATALCGYNGSAPSMSSTFFTFVFRSRPASVSPRTMPMLSAAPRSIESSLLRPPLCPTVASSSSTPLWPLTAARHCSTRETIDSFIDELPTSPTPPIWILPVRCRAYPHFPPAPDFGLAGINRRRHPVATASLHYFRRWAKRPGGPEIVAGPQQVELLWSPIEQWNFPFST